MLEACILALIGGFLLNFMPCVLPVLLLKVASLKAKKKDNLLFALGIISVFATLGILSLTIGLAWGAQFQSPYFVGAMIVSCIVAAALLLDVWTIPVRLRDWGGGPFLTGIFATLLATPCIGPFIPATLLYASKIGIFGPALFILMGVGMAIPYLAAHIIDIERFLPKPGNWMNWLKRLAALSMVVVAGWMGTFLVPSEQAKKEYNDKEFIVITADWCLLCKSNERKITAEFKEKLEQRDIKLVILDYTHPSEEISQLLKDNNVSGIPLYLLRENNKTILKIEGVLTDDKLRPVLDH